MSTWLEEIRWDNQGLVPVIAQDANSQRILMFAYANREAVALTAEKGTAHYWTRSRQKTVAQRRRIRPFPTRARDSLRLRW